MDPFTKESLIARLKQIREQGWIPSRSAKARNDGAVGNTLEDLLGITENNLPLPNAAEWEIKAQRKGSTSLTTLCHVEPSPTAYKIVSKILLPSYGWAHKQAGDKYPPHEQSFRQTIHAHSYSDRGFIVQVDHENKRIVVSFDPSKVDARHQAWLRTVAERVGLGELTPQPYWGFNDLQHKLGAKLPNMFYVFADTRKVAGREEFHYVRFLMLQDFAVDRLINGLAEGFVYIDFDARTGHNHGTKFRVRAHRLPDLYQTIRDIDTL